MTDNDSIEIIQIGDRGDYEPIIRAKPEERLTGGMRMEDIMGIFADDIDDEFMEAVRSIRRGVWPKESRS